MSDKRVRLQLPQRDALMRRLARMLSAKPCVTLLEFRKAGETHRQTAQYAVADMREWGLITTERPSHKTVLIYAAVSPLTVEMVDAAIAAARLPLRAPKKRRDKRSEIDERERCERAEMCERLADAIADGFDPHIQPHHNAIRVISGRRVAGGVWR